MITWLPYWASTGLAYLGLLTAVLMAIEAGAGVHCWAQHRARQRARDRAFRAAWRTTPPGGGA